jgi:hypothetical protein
MSSFPSFPALDLSKFDLSKFDLSKFDLSKIDLSKIDLPELPGVDADRVRETLRDAAYITIGFGVLGVQQAQVRRRELVSFLSERLGASRTQVEEFVDSLELGQYASQLQTAVETLRKQVVGLVRQAA